MSTAAVTLQCPNCGGVFLTLQQGGGGMEICPHCAVAAPRGSYRRVEGQAAFPRPRTALPARRTSPVHLGAQPVTGTGPVPVPETPAPTITPWQSPLTTTAAPVTAPQPETAPAVAPAPAPPPAPAAPLANPALAPLPPPQIGFAPPAEPAPAPTPFHLAELTPPPAKIVPSPGSIGPATVTISEKPRPQPAPLAATTAPVWPGLGVEGSPQPIRAHAPALPTLQAAEETAPSPGWMESQQVPAGDNAPPERPHKTPWLSLLFLLSLACGLGLSMWKSSLPRMFPAGRADEAPTTATPDAPAPSPPPAPDSAAATQTAATTPAPAPAPPLSPGLIPSGDSAGKLRATQELLRALDTAPTLDERLKWIADGEANREPVEKFFATNPEGLQVATVDSNVGLFSELPSGEDVKLFVALTARCPTGAMLRLHPQGGRELLDWPLFQQTHELEFDRFISTGGGEPPRWFSVLCARSRTSDLTGPAAEAHLALNAQGSLSARGEARIHVPKDSDAGRLLESRMVWGRVYLIRMQLQRLELNGKPLVMILDCAGTASAAGERSGEK